MTPGAFRRLALALPGVEEGSHMDHPDFRRDGRVFASLGAPKRDNCMVKVSLEHQAILTEAHPGVWRPAPGAWGRQGSTIAHLPDLDPAIAQDALSWAWQSAGAAAKPNRRPTQEG